MLCDPTFLIHKSNFTIQFGNSVSCEVHSGMQYVCQNHLVVDWGGAYICFIGMLLHSMLRSGRFMARRGKVDDTK